MPLIQIEEILIQGELGQASMAQLKPILSGFAKLSKSSCPDEMLLKLFGNSMVLVLNLDDNELYLYDKQKEPLLTLLAETPENKSHIALLKQSYRDISPNKLTQVTNTISTQFNEMLGQEETTDKVILSAEKRNPSRIDQVSSLVATIAEAAKRKHHKNRITRAITDEFSFYPKDGPYTLDEYKTIIQRTATIAKNLPTDVHLALGTFPVIWPNGKLVNCGLYVQAPRAREASATIHHFQKKFCSTVDFTYTKPDGTIYQFDSTDKREPKYHPDIVLEGTAIATNDINQYESAIKLTTSFGPSFITTIGVCVDHKQGVERQQVHELIDKLQEAKQEVPLHCSHVIISSSIDEHSENILSSISHADPNMDIRRPAKYPGRNGFSQDTLYSPFSDSKLTTETYPAKCVGILHSDIFQHIIAKHPPESLTAYLNKQDEDGYTLLHLVFLENDLDHELLAKRLYALVLNGANPEIKNCLGRTPRELAASNRMTSKAITAALAWRINITLQNKSNKEDGCTALTRALQNEIKLSKNTISALILQGANPYQKDARGLSAMEIINHYSDKNTQEQVREWIHDALKLTQYGNFQTYPYDLYPDIYFNPPPSLLENENSLFKAIKMQLLNELSEILAITGESMITQEKIDAALALVLEEGHWQALSVFFEMEGDNKPSEPIRELAKEKFSAYLQEKNMRGTHFHTAAMNGFEALNKLMLPIVPASILSQGLVSTNIFNWTPIHILYTNTFNKPDFFDDDSFKTTNLSLLLYEMYLECNKESPNGNSITSIKNYLTLLAKEEHHPEAWIALALIAMEAGEPAKANKLIANIEKIGTSISVASSAQAGFLSTSSTSEEQIYKALLCAKPELITSTEADTRNVRGFIEKQQEAIQRIVDPKNLASPEPPTKEATNPNP